MNKTTKLILGVVTFLPLLYIIFFSFTFDKLFVFDDPTYFFMNFQKFSILVILHLFSILLTIGLLIFYISNVFKNEKVPRDKKKQWALIIFFGHVIAMPIYWYINIWKDK